METYIYVDVLLVLNYAVMLLLLLCCSKISGRAPRRCRVVAGALVGSVSSLAIFLPYMGFVLSILFKLALSGLIVAVVYAPLRYKAFFSQLVVFFTVNFLFAGVMVALWITLAPQGMLCFNGVVYFDISPVVLIGSTALAYLILSAVNRIFKSGRLPSHICKVHIYRGDAVAGVTGLMDTGNSLYEPFSDTPVMVCWVEDLRAILPQDVIKSVVSGSYMAGEKASLPLRLVPYEGVGGIGVIPAFKPDRVEVVQDKRHHQVQRVYVGLSPKRVGTGAYNAILNPDLIGVMV